MTADRIPSPLFAKESRSMRKMPVLCVIFAVVASACGSAPAGGRADRENHTQNRHLAHGTTLLGEKWRRDAIRRHMLLPGPNRFNRFFAAARISAGSRPGRRIARISPRTKEKVFRSRITQETRFARSNREWAERVRNREPSPRLSSATPAERIPERI